MKNATQTNLKKSVPLLLLAMKERTEKELEILELNISALVNGVADARAHGWANQNEKELEITKLQKQYTAEDCLLNTIYEKIESLVKKGGN